MPTKLKNMLDTRLAITIAAGVFGGLIGYRLFVWARGYWTDLGSGEQQDMLSFALFAAAAGFAYYGIRRLFVRYRWDLLTLSPDAVIAHRVSSRERHAMQSALLSFFLLISCATLDKDAVATFWITFCVAAAWLISQIAGRVKDVHRDKLAKAALAESSSSR